MKKDGSLFGSENVLSNLRLLMPSFTTLRGSDITSNKLLSLKDDYGDYGDYEVLNGFNYIQLLMKNFMILNKNIDTIVLKYNAKEDEFYFKISKRFFFKLNKGLKLKKHPQNKGFGSLMMEKELKVDLKDIGKNLSSIYDVGMISCNFSEEGEKIEDVKVTVSAVKSLLLVESFLKENKDFTFQWLISNQTELGVNREKTKYEGNSRVCIETIYSASRPLDLQRFHGVVLNFALTDSNLSPPQALANIERILIGQDYTADGKMKNIKIKL